MFITTSNLLVPSPVQLSAFERYQNSLEDPTQREVESFSTVEFFLSRKDIIPKNTIPSVYRGHPQLYKWLAQVRRISSAIPTPEAFTELNIRGEVPLFRARQIYEVGIAAQSMLEEYVRKFAGRISRDTYPQRGGFLPIGGAYLAPKQGWPIAVAYDPVMFQIFENAVILPFLHPLSDEGYAILREFMNQKLGGPIGIIKGGAGVSDWALAKYFDPAAKDEKQAELALVDFMLTEFHALHPTLLTRPPIRLPNRDELEMFGVSMPSNWQENH